MSKVHVGTHIFNAYSDFIRIFVSEEDLVETLLPTMEKASLRSPEISLPVISSFLSAYSQPPTLHVFRRILSLALSGAKSSNPLTRTGAINLFKTLLPLNTSPESASLAMTELLTLPKTGKTTGPDHRLALYSMLAHITPSQAVSATLLQTTTPLLAKETHEGVITVLAGSLSTHLIHLLTTPDSAPLASETTSLLAKEMGNLKPGIRRAFWVLAGSVLVGGLDFEEERSLNFVKALLPALEAGLKNVAANPVNSSAGPLEAYVATAVLLGPLAKTGKFDDAISKNAALQSIASGSTKPSFLLWDKVYQKLTDPVDEKWLLQAWEASLIYFKTEFTKNENLCSQSGLALIHLSLESSTPEVRREVISVVERCAKQVPGLTNRVVREGLTTFFARGSPSSTSTATSAEEASAAPWNKHSRLSGLLLAAASFAEGTEQKVKDDVIVKAVLVGHHHLISKDPRQTWIDLCQRSSIDPHELVTRNLDKLFQLILNGPTAADAKFGFAEAGYNAVGTLAFVAPEEVLPRLIDQLRSDMDQDVVNALTESDFGIWETPEGTTYVDVLTSKGETKTTIKGKDAELAKWDEETKRNIASKKAAASKSLTKQQQALVDAQLKQEAKVRQHVVDVQARLFRGLRIVRSLVRSGVEEFRNQISLVASLILKAPLGRGSILVGEEAFQTYLVNPASEGRRPLKD
ncbi:hypothetical protein H0H93_008704 [Arthromyces matolae]|nr:hypothetical protein H0H93_008704 [Arthromyces matolae]